MTSPHRGALGRNFEAALNRTARTRGADRAGAADEWLPTTDEFDANAAASAPMGGKGRATVGADNRSVIRDEGTCHAHRQGVHQRAAAISFVVAFGLWRCGEPSPEPK